ncbi:MAG: LysR substrate-binding domain-containing protein [Pikeienuella sp.]
MSRLPSLIALRAFEAAARLGGFKQAAAVLHVSPTAISHHIRGLEADLDIALFRRGARGVALTDEGAQLAAACADSFRGLEQAVEALRPATGRRTVRLALGPIIAARWLAPRLTKFWQAFPDIDLQLIRATGGTPPPDADLAIIWTDQAEAGNHLLSVTATPVAAPGLLAQFGTPETPADLLKLPLIHNISRIGWSEWFQLAGVNSSHPPGILTDDANVALRGAIEAQGVALGLSPLIDDDVAEGRLVRLFNLSMPHQRRYVVGPATDSNNRRAAAVRAWLLGEV